LEPDLEAFTFSGVCEIRFDVDRAKLSDENTREITLHAKDLLFSKVSYVALGGDDDDDDAKPPVEASEIVVNLKAKTVRFVFPESISADKIKLSIHYSGFLNNEMAGFYRSRYKDIEGNQKWMASTQFESLDARRCFPCVDEPAAKAVFGVAFTVPANLTVLSNMPVSSVATLSKTKKKVAFQDTPIMSTYLLAFCVGEFDCLAAQTNNGVLVKVFTPPGESHLGSFALKVACQSLDDYDRFFGLHYPLPKLDLIAIPEFAMGAMEVSRPFSLKGPSQRRSSHCCLLALSELGTGHVP
jgi:aminopeptidase N